MADGVTFTVAIEDGGITKAILTRLQRLRNLDPALEEIGAANLAETEQRFEKQRDPEGKTWPGYSPNTTFAKGRTRPRMLRDRGDLYDSLTYQVLSGRSVGVGTNKRYARIHQLGGKAGRGRKVTIPARPYLGLSNEGAEEILQIVTDHLER